MDTTKQYHLVRHQTSGVWIGELSQPNRSGFLGTTWLQLNNARRLHTWREALDCASLATRGPGTESKATRVVKEVLLPTNGVIEILTVEEAAILNLNEVPEWEP